MTFMKLYGTRRGSHVHIAVFIAHKPGAEIEDIKTQQRSKAGDLIVDAAEWADIQRMADSQTFGLHASFETVESKEGA